MHLFPKELVEDVAKLLEEHDLPRLNSDKYGAKGAVGFDMTYRGTAIHLLYQLDLSEKQKKKTINEEKGEAADKEDGEAIGKDVINSEEDEAAEVEDETAEVEDGFDKEESVIE
ncbi:5116_t:CDS:2, partial [Ambispora gerdemannii]